ncbi:MAG: hypothetical protein HQK53_11525 [Oligoflexia bacterium]|nr:hypothetical protein [Oligoflexia bacterium]
MEDLTENFFCNKNNNEKLEKVTIDGGIEVWKERCSGQLCIFDYGEWQGISEESSKAIQLFATDSLGSSKGKGGKGDCRSLRKVQIGE